MSHELRATEQILGLLERSKQVSDLIADSLPGAFLIVDSSARILRTNLNVARHMGQLEEDLLGRSLEIMFRPSHWRILRDKIDKLFAFEVDRAEVELPLTDVNGVDLAHFWEIRRLGDQRADHAPLAVLLARDVSQLKSALHKVLQFEQNLQLAHSAQALLLPSRYELSGDGWSFASMYEPSLKAGGDWWTYQLRHDGTPLIMLGDVTGHDLGAAMVTALVTGVYKTVLSLNPEADIGSVFGCINSQLCDLSQEKYWMTMAALELDLVRDCAHWHSAAAPFLIHMKADKSFEIVVEKCSPLGAGQLDTAVKKIGFEQGDRLLLATDGLYDLLLGERFRKGMRELEALLKIEPGFPSAARNAMYERVIQARAKVADTDDIAFVIIDRT